MTTLLLLETLLPWLLKYYSPGCTSLNSQTASLLSIFQSLYWLIKLVCQRSIIGSLFFYMYKLFDCFYTVSFLAICKRSSKWIVQSSCLSSRCICGRIKKLHMGVFTDFSHSPSLQGKSCNCHLISPLLLVS